MNYVIQENVFREEHYNVLEESLKRLGLNYATVRVFPFVDKIVDINDLPDVLDNVDDLPDYEPPSKNTIIFGSVKLTRISKKRNWTIGTFLNDNHDYEVYSKYYKDNLLNYDSEIINLGDDISWKKDEIKFIRPTLDTKSFTGACFNERDFEIMKTNHLHNFRSNQFNEETKIQISSPKKIYKEIRVWIVDGEVITASQYTLGGRLVLDDIVDEDALDFTKEMIDIFQLADAFVMDVCLTENGWKIVECGCINSAGFYKANMQKIIVALENKYEGYE